MLVTASHGSRKIEFEYDKDNEGKVIPKKLVIRKEDEKYGLIEVVIEKGKTTIKANSLLFEYESDYPQWFDSLLSHETIVSEFYLQSEINHILFYLIHVIPKFVEDTIDRFYKEER